jgi:hypothetical protein
MLQGSEHILLVIEVGGISATTSWTVKLLGISIFHEINIRLTICQLIWTALGFSPDLLVFS